MNKKEYADFRVSETKEVLMILDDEILNVKKSHKFTLESNKLYNDSGSMPIIINIDDNDLLKEFEQCKKFQVVQATKAGFFQIIPNIKLVKAKVSK
jgi:hypothetical protein